MRDFVHPLEFFAFSARHGIGVRIVLRPIFGKPVGADTDIDKSLRLGVKMKNLWQAAIFDNFAAIGKTRGMKTGQSMRLKTCAKGGATIVYIIVFDDLRKITNDLNAEPF